MKVEIQIGWGRLEHAAGQDEVLQGGRSPSNTGWAGPTLLRPETLGPLVMLACWDCIGI